MPSPLAQSRPVEWQSAEANDRNVKVHHTWQQGLSCKWKLPKDRQNIYMNQTISQYKISPKYSAFYWPTKMDVPFLLNHNMSFREIYTTQTK